MDLFCRIIFLENAAKFSFFCRNLSEALYYDHASSISFSRLPPLSALATRARSDLIQYADTRHTTFVPLVGERDGPCKNVPRCGRMCEI